MVNSEPVLVLGTQQSPVAVPPVARHPVPSEHEPQVTHNAVLDGGEGN